MGWQKMFANHIFAKRFVIGIYKELPKVNNKKNNLIFKKAKYFNRHFINGDIWMASKCIERFLTSLGIRCY